jgi:hypothetical protein
MLAWRLDYIIPWLVVYPGSALLPGLIGHYPQRALALMQAQ